MTELLCPVTEKTEWRSRLQRMNKGGADELFVWCEKLELAMNEGEELFFERGFPQARIFADGSNSLIHFLLEEMQGDVFLGPEIVEDGAFGDGGLAGDRF